MEEFKIISYAFAGGILPALFWLWFWLREDRKYPEPKRMIALTFFLGAVAVVMVIPVQEAVQYITGFFTASVFVKGVILTVAWAFTEEFAKLFFALPALKSKFTDEPIDAVIYLLTAALGFAALENILYIYGTFLESGNISEPLLLGNHRFIGASLLHVVSSATVGFFIAFSFYKSKKFKTFSFLLGLVIATAIHSLYNHLLGTDNMGAWALIGIWVAVISLFIIFEKMKVWEKIKMKKGRSNSGLSNS